MVSPLLLIWMHSFLSILGGH